MIQKLRMVEVAAVAAALQPASILRPMAKPSPICSDTGVAGVGWSQQQLGLESVWPHPFESWSDPLTAGVDEVGRGALFGPVVAAAVMLPTAALAPLLARGMTDSKQLKPAERRQLAQHIQSLALSYRVGIGSVWEIDRLNILRASLLAMQRAVLRLQPLPARCLIDGNQPIPALPMPQQTIVKGDQQVPQIAAASILAKVWRDDLISRLAKRYPVYDLAQNKGYGTPRHRRALLEYGPSFFHRRSFAPCNLGCDDPSAMLGSLEEDMNR